MEHTFNYGRLRGRMRELGITQEEAASKINITPTTFSLKLNNASEFSQSEIRRLCDFLAIPAAQIPDYFFSQWSLEN